MIFRPKITNTNRNPNTITNINTKITNTNFKYMIFPFKITNQTQISDLWFSFFRLKNQKHKHELTWLTQTEPRKKKEKRKRKWRMRWSEVVSRLWPWARKMKGKEDYAIVWDRRRQGWNRVEKVDSLGLVTLTELGQWRRLGMAVRVGSVVRELAEGEIENEWDCDLWVREWDCMSETEENRDERGGLCELKWNEEEK